MALEAIVAVYADWGIGLKGTQPVVLKADRKHFREITGSDAVIVGRRTMEDFPGGRPLKGRHNIVITRQNLTVEGAEVAHTTDEALRLAAQYDRCLVIGGDSVFRQFFPHMTRVFITKIPYHENRPDPGVRPVFPRPGRGPRMAVHRGRPLAGGGRRPLPLLHLRESGGADLRFQFCACGFERTGSPADAHPPGILSVSHGRSAAAPGVGTSIARPPVFRTAALGGGRAMFGHTMETGAPHQPQGRLSAARNGPFPKGGCRPWLPLRGSCQRS